MRPLNLERFEANYTPEPNTGCWLWTGASYRSGYGSFANMHAHRAGWILHRGPIPEGMLACHKCDNRACVNPDHIFLGTHADNAQDMSRKGRQVFQRDPSKAPSGDRNGSRTCPESRPRGSNNALAKMTEQSVAEMRRTVRAGLRSVRSWAVELGVSYACAKQAVRGVTWRHVPLVLLLVAASAAEAQPTPRFKRFTQRTPQGRSTRGFLSDSYSFFEAFPASGAGTTTACSTTAPTGAKGEVLTFTRTGSATCTKTSSGGLATTGIADGDLVSLSGNVARVEYDSAGVLGLRVESARTNDLLRSQELNNAAWSTVGTAMTITPDFATAPDGTATAERLQIPATSGAGLSLRAQTALSSGVRSGSCYVKGNGTSGTLDIYQSGASVSCGGCAYNATTWTRCTLTSGAAVTTFHIGNDSLDCASAARGAADVLVWGCQSELGTYATSYIPTTAGAAVRNAEQAEFALASHTLSAPLSIAGTAWLPPGLPTNARLHGTVGPSGLATYLDSYLSAGTWVADSTQVTPNSYITAQSTTASSTVRAITYHDGTNFAGCFGASCSTTARAWSSLANVVIYRPGMYSSGAGVCDCIVSRACYQPGDSTRCR